MADFALNLTLTADGRVFIKELSQSEVALGKFGDSARKSGRAASENFAVAARGSANLRAEVAQATGAVASLLGLLGGSTAIKGFARSFIAAADAQGQLEARLRRVANSQAEYNYALERMKGIAHDAYVSINSVAEIYVRSIEPMRQLGFTTKETLDLTEALSLSLVVSAADAQKRASAVDALSKVMQTGVLRMDEFNTIVTASPRFIDALEAALGKTRAQLIGMVNDGDLTVAEIAKVGSQLGLLRDEVEDMPTTVEDAATRFGDAFQVWAGSANDAHGATTLLVSGIDLLSKHIDTVMMAAVVGVTAGVGVLLTQLFNWVATARQQAVASRAAAAATLQAAEAAVMRAKSEQALALTTQRAAQLDLAAAKSADARAAALMRVVNANLAVNQTRAGVRAAEDALNDAAQSASSFGNKINVAVGIVSAAAIGYEVGTWARGLESVRVAADYMVGGFDLAWKTIKAGVQVAWSAIKAAFTGGINWVREKLANLVGGFADIAMRMPGGGAMAESLSNLETQLRPTTSAAATFRGEVNAIGTTLLEQGQGILQVVGDMADYERSSGNAARAAEEFARTGNVSARTVDAALADLTKRMKGQDAQLNEQIATYGKGRAATLEYARSQDLLKAATITDAAARERYVAGVNATYTPLIDLAKNLDAVTASHGNAKKASEDSLKAQDDFLANLREQIETFGLADAALLRYQANKLNLSGPKGDDANALIARLTETKALAEVNKDAASAMERLHAAEQASGDELEDLNAQLGGASAAQMAFNKTQREARRDLVLAMKAMDPSAMKAFIAAIAKAKEVLEQADLGSQLSEALQVGQQALDANKSPFQTLTEDANKLREAIEAAGGPTTDLGKQLQEMLDAKNFQRTMQAFDDLQTGLRALQSLTEQGSDSFKDLEKAIAVVTLMQQTLATVEAVRTILAVGANGDGYTAVFRMAAVAAAIAPMLAAIGAAAVAFGGGGGGGPSGQSAEVRQAAQGTGTVLGDPTEKSESIANAMEITADATSELVGINRGMLRALESLEKALGAAGGLLARGAGDVNFPDPGGGGLFLGLWGESNELIDQGIIIAGGALQDMLNAVVVGAYQTIESNGGFFGSDETYDNLVDVSDQFSQQFSLVIGSLIDTVREGAEALGLLPADIEAAIAAFEVQQIRISLMDLSAEEQQAELEAVFSSIFDGLAGAVVPFIEQFQQVGEGLGETLVRIATEVQVTQEAIAQLGLAVDETDPERFAQIADGLVQASGGLEDFISSFQSFVSNFATEQHQFTATTAALASALGQVGLAVPGTRGEMFALMQSLDATTAQGQEQIATLLRLSSVADQYYSALEDQDGALRGLIAVLGIGSASLSDFGQSLVDIRQSGQSAVAAANAIARAQGREGASAIQLARIHQWTADQIAAAIRKLQAETQDLIAKLYGGVPGTLDAINERIQELEGATGGLSDGIGAVEDASAQLFESWMQGVQTVQDYLDSMLLGDLSALSPEQQLAEAQRQLLAMQQLAMGGDATALAQLPQLADAFLRLLQGSGASGEDYATGFQWVRDLLQSVVDMPNPGTQSTGADTVELVPSAELTALYAARDAAEAAADLERRAEWARQLTQNLADLSTIMQVPILQLIEAQGVNLHDLATDIGVDFENLGLQSVTALGFLASTLGVSMTTLTGQLGLSLTDLRAGLTEMAASVGVDLSALTVETTQTLAAMAGSLGMNLTELSTSLGVSLGELTDAQSLINQALGAEISALPADQAAQLAPLFEALAAATTEADANTAITALEAAVNEIGGATANALAPYLAGVFPVRALDQLDYLGEIQSIAADQLDVLGLIRDNLRAANVGAGVPSYAVGTGYVPSTGLAMIHQGEMIIPAPVADFHRRAGLPMGGSNDAVVAEVRALREEVTALRRENNAGYDKVVQTVAKGDNDARTQREDIARRDQDTRRSRQA